PAPAPPAQCLQRSTLPLETPGAQVRRVQPLAAQQGSDRARLLLALRVPQDPQLVLRGEPPPRRLRAHLGIWPRGPHRLRGPSPAYTNFRGVSVSVIIDKKGGGCSGATSAGY